MVMRPPKEGVEAAPHWLIRMVEMEGVQPAVPIIEWELCHGEKSLVILSLNPMMGELFFTDIRRGPRIFQFLESDAEAMIRRISEYGWSEPPLIREVWDIYRDVERTALGQEIPIFLRILKDKWEEVLEAYQNSKLLSMKSRDFWEKKLSDIPEL